MASAPHLSDQESRNIRIEAGLYDEVEEMIVGNPYLVMEVVMHQLTNELFAVLKPPLLIRVPQRFHENLRRLIIIMRLNNVNHFHLDRVGCTPDGVTILQASGENFSVTM
jgi:hypothetical protein